MRFVLIVLIALGTLPASAAENPAKAFTITDVGSATGLVPGGTVTRQVRVTNPNAQAVKVTRLDTTVGRPSQSCPSGVVTVAPPALPVLVPGRGSVDVPLTVRMAPTAPNACKNLVFSLTYSGTATKS